MRRGTALLGLSVGLLVATFIMLTGCAKRLEVKQPEAEGAAEASQMQVPELQVVPVTERLPVTEAVPEAPVKEEVARAPEMPLAKEELPGPSLPEAEAEVGRMRAPTPQVVPAPEAPVKEEVARAPEMPLAKEEGPSLPEAEAEVGRMRAPTPQVVPVPEAPVKEEVARAPEMPLAKEGIMKGPPEGQAPVPSGLAESLEGLKDVFFDFDKAVIREDMQKVLDENVEWLKANPTVKVLIEGHCDERGTNEYNLALGERRAKAVKDYLDKAGIDPARIEMISYGEERPFVLGHDESAWKWNRRAHFVVVQ